jgi:chemotaxis protein MotB
MTQPNNTQPIIIIRKKVAHAGHHGGAWKVAYADFVTAMMAFFIVMWLMNSSVKIRKAISVYFSDPSGTGQMSGSAQAGTGEALTITKDRMEHLKDDLEQAFKRSPEFEKLKNYVQMSVTGEGLRIELLESEQGMFFQSGSPRPSDLGEEMIIRMSEQLGQLPNPLLVEGHTDSKPFGKKGDYTNWELSADRANAARRIMEAHGVRRGQVSQVRGFADQNLRNKDDPEAATNRRVSVIVRYLPQDIPAPPDEEGREAKKPDVSHEKPAEHHGRAPKSQF